MAVEIKQLDIPEPVEPVEFEITLRLTRNEARDLWTRMYEFPYTVEPTTVVRQLCDAFSDVFNGRIAVWDGGQDDRLHPNGVTRWEVGARRG